MPLLVAVIEGGGLLRPMKLQLAHLYGSAFPPCVQSLVGFDDGIPNIAFFFRPVQISRRTGRSGG